MLSSNRQMEAGKRNDRGVWSSLFFSLKKYTESLLLTRDSLSSSLFLVERKFRFLYNALDLIRVKKTHILSLNLFSRVHVKTVNVLVNGLNVTSRCDIFNLN